MELRAYQQDWMLCKHFVGCLDVVLLLPVGSWIFTLAILGSNSGNAVVWVFSFRVSGLRAGLGFGALGFRAFRVEGFQGLGL